MLNDYSKDQTKYKPKTKLSGLKTCPKGPDLTESIVPGSRSMRMARGTYLPPSHTNNQHNILHQWQHYPQCKLTFTRNAAVVRKRATAVYTDGGCNPLFKCVSQ